MDLAEAHDRNDARNDGRDPAQDAGATPGVAADAELRDERQFSAAAVVVEAGNGDDLIIMRGIRSAARRGTMSSAWRRGPSR
jgi:hypothetical protein